MPLNLKIILSLLVLLVGSGMYVYETRIGNDPVQWIVTALVVAMIAALWLFPEAGKRPDEKR